MLVTVNGKPLPIEEGLPLQSLLEQLGLTQARVAVELNRKIIPRSQHSEQVLSDGDVLEVVQAIGGG